MMSVIRKSQSDFVLRRPGCTRNTSVFTEYHHENKEADVETVFSVAARRKGGQIARLSP